MLFAALVVASAFVSPANQKKVSGAATPNTPTRHRHSALGSRVRPIPLHHPAVVKGPYESKGPWRMKILRVVLDADTLIGRVKDFGSTANSPPSTGAQYVMVTVSLRLLGGGSSSAEYLANRIFAIGKHAAPYHSDCIPPTPLDRSGSVFSDQTASGNVCFEVASNDVKTLDLYVDQSQFGTNANNRVWFRLRP